ncbi:MAG: hypothetical protein JJT77_07900, partial [Crocinitomicaceae bacterium]|nr:hypothetical protein [Crocinitomicaceae bacterium]
SQIEKLVQIISKLENKARQWILLRLFAFLLIPATIYLLFESAPLVVISASIATLMIFLFFVRKSAENKDALAFHRRLEKINRDELLALQYDFTAFDNGDDFINQKHAFSYDMDVFGPKGIFPMINRTQSKDGQNKLKDVLLSGRKEPLENFHQATEELIQHVEWTQTFRASMSDAYQKIGQKDYAKWLEKNIQAPKWMQIMQWINPIVGWTSFIAYQLNFLNGTQLLFTWFLLLIPVLYHVKRTNLQLNPIIDFQQQVDAALQQMTLLKQQDFQADLLKTYKNQLFEERGNGLNALFQFQKLIKKIAYRHNILVGVLLNIFFGWDYRMQIQLQAWQKQFQNDLIKWLDILSEMEVLICAMNFRYNNYAQCTYPKIYSDESNSIQIEKLGHPLVPIHKLVSNNYSLTENQHFTILTGPNMAGKSTFLRSIGVNLMLAKAGFPVLAKTFHFPNYQLYTSMRTTDDLADESSYFHAELVRLRFIVNAAERGEKVFIILDEILKGTNSKDKEEGSAKFLEKLLNLHCKGIIATHDLSLTKLADKHNALINRYFDTKIEGDEISFDYKIKDGIAQNMNASFLLQKMGLTNTN